MSYGGKGQGFVIRVYYKAEYHYSSREVRCLRKEVAYPCLPYALTVQERFDLERKCAKENAPVGYFSEWKRALVILYESLETKAREAYVRAREEADAARKVHVLVRGMTIDEQNKGHIQNLAQNGYER